MNEELKEAEAVRNVMENAADASEDNAEENDVESSDEADEDSSIENEESDNEENAGSGVAPESNEEGDLADDTNDILASITYTRMPCLPHTLQLVIKESEKQKAINKVVTKARSLVKKIRKCGKAVEDVVKKTGKTLLVSCPTRWNSMLAMFKRLIELNGRATTYTLIIQYQYWNIILLNY